MAVIHLYFTFNGLECENKNKDLKRYGLQPGWPNPYTPSQNEIIYKYSTFTGKILSSKL